jgi:hypothetical protein
MGKSFNDDIFNNDFNIESINGLNISKEAIEENQEKNKPKEKKADTKDKPKINVDLDKLNEYKKQYEKEERERRKNKDKEEVARELQEEIDRYTSYEDEIKNIRESEESNTIYTKKTMIFKQEYLDIIDGLADINDMQIKDVLNQLLEKAINQLDEKTREKALKSGKKAKQVKVSKNIF